MDDDIETNGIFMGADLAALDEPAAPPVPQDAPRALPLAARQPGAPVPEERPPLQILPVPRAAAAPVPRGGRRPVALPFGQEVVPNEGAHMLGLNVMLLATGAALGVRYGGGYGGIAGGLAAGAVSNGLRAALALRDPSMRREAMISGSYAVVAAAGAAWLWYKVVRRPLIKNSSSSTDHTLAAWANENGGVTRLA